MRESSSAQFKETLAVGGFASALLLAISWPAFKYYFYAEAFWALRIYNQNGRHLWRAAFSKIDGMFFRPGFFLAHLAWISILPPDPLLYHIRNFIFCAANVFLLYLIFSKLVQSRLARIIAVLLFAVSKMHLSIIGSINTFEASVLLLNELVTVWLWIRYVEKRLTLDYVLTLVFCALAVYSKENGFIIIAIQVATVLALAQKTTGFRKEIGYWVVRFIPFVALAASYLILRYILTGPLNPNNPVYSPRLSLYVTARQTAGFLATVGNLALTSPGTMGARGLTAVLAGDSKKVELLLCAAFWLLILYTVWLSRSAWRAMILSVAWIGCYLAPIFLIRNHQVYYYQEPLVGLSLLIGISLTRANRSLLTGWTLVVVLIAVNGYISNRHSLYDWEYTANQVAKVRPLVATYRANPPESIVLVTTPEQRDFWIFAIGGPTLPYLMGARNLQVELLNRNSNDLASRRAQAKTGTIFFDLETGSIDLLQSSQVAVPNNASEPQRKTVNASLKANPNPVQVCDNSGLGVTTISYEFPEQASVEVHVNSASGDLFAKPSANGSQTTGKWVTEGMVLYLQDVSEGKPLTPENTIDKITLHLTTAGCQ